MGVDTRKAPPLPAATDTDTVSGTGTGTELNTDLSRATEKSSYSIPEDGTPVEIVTRRKKHGDGLTKGSHQSQTSLLIEYFEGGKSGQETSRRPSVRVKVTPSSKSRSRSANEHIQITETSRSGRKPSYSKRINLSPNAHGERVIEEGENGSISSYASATEESNLSRNNPIDIEVMPKRPSSPLIPSEVPVKEVQQLGSDVSSMPADSFLDGKPGIRSPERKRSRSLTRGEALISGAAAGLAAGVVGEKLKTVSRRRSRSLSRERIVAQKAVEKVRGEKSERRHKHSSGSRSRSVSNSKDHAENVRSPRRRTSRSHVEESMISGGDSSILSTSRVSGEQRSVRSGASKSSINNPKLLETVEDAIRRLILPELTAMKEEQKLLANRDKFERDRRGSLTPGSAGSRESREERRISGRSSAPDVSGRHSGEPTKLRKERKYDSFGSDGSPRSFERGASEETVLRDSPRSHEKRRDKKSTLGALAAGVGLGALAGAALQHHDSKDSLDERQERRRRRVKSRSRSDSMTESYEESLTPANHPPMPMMSSDVNSSEVTRTSILSAETDRPNSATAEQQLTPVHNVKRRVVSPSTRTPTRSPLPIHEEAFTEQHETPVEHSRNETFEEEYDINDRGEKVPLHTSTETAPPNEHYYADKHNGFHNPALTTGLAAAGGALAGAAAMHHWNDTQEPHYTQEDYDYYGSEQQVPAPLRYIPYNAQKRGLSPIQSVSGYTEDNDPDFQQKQRDSHLTRSTNSYSTLDQSPQHRSIYSQRSNPQYQDYADIREDGLANPASSQEGEYYGDSRQRDLDEESYRSDPKHLTTYTDDSLNPSLNEKITAGQNVRGVGANPDFVHTPLAVESAVASLISASEVTRDSNQSALDRKASYASYDEGSERRFTSRGNSPEKHDGAQNVEYGESERDYVSQQNSPTRYPEYELDDQGRKITMPDYRRTQAATGSGSAARDALAGIAAGAAAAILADRRREKEQQQRAQYQEREEPLLASPQKSFKDRAMEYQGPPRSPRHSIDKLLDDEVEEPIQMGASGIPDAHDPMPEIGYGAEEGSEITTNPSVIQGPIGGEYREDHEQWPSKPQPKLDTAAATRNQHSDPKLREAEMDLLAAAAGAGAAAALANHNRETGHDHDEEWARTSDERKRDTLITNPYEGTSPVTLLGGEKDRTLLDKMGYEGVKPKPDYDTNKFDYKTMSPGGLPKDEGYISSAPNARSPGLGVDRKGKGVDFLEDVGLDAGAEALAGGDPFYSPKHGRHLSGLSHGQSPLYDSATGYGKDRIQSKDIIALMDHLTVRDAQRNARDTEILATLVQAATEMKQSFNHMQRLLADTEDVIITEVQRNTDNSVQKAINGPRPYPQSKRSSRGPGDELYDDIPAKKRNVFRRALKGLTMRSSNDLAKIEDMLIQLLGDVEGLKHAQGLQNRSIHEDSYDLPEGGYEPDRGYEPEGNAGTSTASHASQSGHFSIPLSRGTSAARGLDGRKYSENRISTVPEGDEEELDAHEQNILNNQFENNEQLLTPIKENVRGSSVPLSSPPQQYVATASLSNEHTPISPQTAKKKGKTNSWNPIPKISRWSETTASTVARGFRSSGRRDSEQFEVPASRSGSDLANYDDQQHDYVADKLHSGFSQDNLPESPLAEDEPKELASMLPQEEPKYKAQRNSLLLQHPQPRPGPTHRYQTALETQAADYRHNSMSPRSAEWGSNTSVNRLPQNMNTNRYSGGTTGTDGSAHDQAYYKDHGSPTVESGPARPPKEPLLSNPITNISTAPERPPKIQMNTNQPVKPSPLGHGHMSVDDGDDMEDANKAYREGMLSPAAGSGRRVGSGVRSSSGLGPVPARKPTGPRSMGESPRSATRSVSDRGVGERQEDLDEGFVGRSKNRDTFGTVQTQNSGESETF